MKQALKHRLYTATIAVCALIASHPAVADEPETCGYGMTVAKNGVLNMAVCKGDLATIKNQVEAAHADPNARDSDGRSALDVAFNSSTVYWQSGFNPKVIAYLVTHGADANAGDYLAAAAVFGDVEVAQILLDAGADVNRPTGSGNRPLHAAARCDFRLSADSRAKAMVALLLSRNADLTLTNNSGMSVLETVPTPCSYQAELCAEDRLADATWPTGSCKQTYLIVRDALAATNR